MSEYQCCEFVALDAPLSAKQMAELRAGSTRADITSTRFWNEYHWGNLKADPLKLVARYFDAHAYFANWGTRRLMLRISAGHVAPKLLRARDDFSSNAPLATLTPIRAELERGDLRAAYLAWLLAVQVEDVRDDALEPLVPDGLPHCRRRRRPMAAFGKRFEAMRKRRRRRRGFFDRWKRANDPEQ